jgi:GT2 family glycosyltransferase
MEKVAIILINYKDYAEKYLPDCLASLRRQNYPGEMKLFIVDNESSEKSFNYLRSATTSITNNTWRATSLVSDVEIIRNEHNDGFAKGNNDAIKQAMEQNFEYIILFNMDTVIDENCVSEMMKVALTPASPNPSSPPSPSLSPERGAKKDEGNVGAVQARLMLWPEKDKLSLRRKQWSGEFKLLDQKINSLGNITHFLGFGYCLNYGEKLKIENLKFKIFPICYPSGAAVLFKSSVLKQVGLFDEKFWMYNEDQDLGWRIWLAGFRCVLAPEAVVYHKYEFSRSISKYYWMDRNRILAILKNYHWATLIMVAPALLLMEVGLFVFSLSNGWFKEKLNVYKYFIQPSNWKYILKTRQETQNMRKIKDREILKMFAGKIWYQEIGDWKLRLINPVFTAYFWVVKKVVWW